MSLNIKNERVCRLAKEAAALTGQSQAVSYTHLTLPTSDLV